MSLKYLSLFSGIGAFEMALKNININYELVGFSEIDKFAIKSYCEVHNVNEKLNLGDITKIDIDKLPKDINLITHGSPCQSFSSAGLQHGGDKGSGTRSSLMWNTVEIVKHCKPTYVIWENVKNVLSKNHIHNFEQYLNELESIGYTNYYSVLNARDFGVPQNRERIFVISILDNKAFTFPQPIPLNTKIQDLVDKDNKVYNEITIADNIKPCVKVNFEREKYDIANSEKDIYQCKCKGGWQDNKVGIKVCPTIRANNSYTSIYYDNYIKRLSPKECFRFMGMDENIYDILSNINISDSQQYKIAGNSIVVPILEAIFKNLLL